VPSAGPTIMPKDMPATDVLAITGVRLRTRSDGERAVTVAGGLGWSASDYTGTESTPPAFILRPSTSAQDEEAQHEGLTLSLSKGEDRGGDSQCER
jgi:hypothetical protein